MGQDTTEQTPSETTVRGEFYSALKRAAGKKPGWAVIHSSLAGLAPPDSLTKWDILYAIGLMVQDGWTLAFPAFTFSFCRNGHFDRENSPSETGVLANWVMSGFPEARRTDHPIYSFVVVGRRAQELTALRPETTFGDTSPFRLFEEHEASIIMLGVDWSFCTSFHRYEEKAEVPYRLFKTFTGEIVRDGTAATGDAKMYVRDLDIDAANDFSPLVEGLRSKGLICTVPLWRSKIESARMTHIRESAEALLEEDPLALVENAPSVRHHIEIARERARIAPFRIALLGSSNLDIAANGLREQLEELMPCRRCEVFVPPYGQMAQQVMSPGSELDRFNPELSVFADRLEDLVLAASLALADGEAVIGAVKDYAELIRRFSADNGGTVAVHRFALLGRQSIERAAALSSVVRDANGLLEEALTDAGDIIWIDTAAEAAQGDTGDARMWYIAHIPFSADYTARLVRRWSGIVLAQLGKTARLIVLDLDNTLWGGVLGEDGKEGIAIGGDFPGNAYATFQQTLKTMSDNGVALAVVSKNDEDLALDALETHKSMVIRPSDLVSHRINWKPKVENIRDIADELDLGLGSVLFIDDNPVEREAVRLNLPMVKVLDLPADPTAYTSALFDSPYLEVIRVGQEDRKRVASYKARNQINAERSAAASLEDFLRGLRMKLHVQDLDESNIARAAQLCQKTNQFNTTTRRYSARELQDLRSAGCDVAVIGLEDRFMARENIGLIIVRPDESDGERGSVDLLLLSCRVLGRTVENAVLGWAIGRAHARNWSTLSGEIIETPRNTPVRKVFEENGFKNGQTAGIWYVPTRPAALPDWFELHDGFDK